VTGGADHRGRLRIYLGSAPGAGTTCALLEEGRRHAEQGADVVVAHAETRGRPYTRALLEGIEVIPHATVPYRGTTVVGMDLDAVLARRPKIALLDDFADRNAPGARHAWRWQDAAVLLAAGIDVISTVRVDHLDSLADVVANITGATPRQGVPDPVVRAADEVEMVDLAPEVLRDRMGCGHIYAPPEAEEALRTWFQTGNLSALRELALLWLATTLASDRGRQLPDGHTPWNGRTRERVVVALSGRPRGDVLIRRAARIAARGGGDLLAVHATWPGGPVVRGRAALTAQRQLIEALGGTYNQIVGTDIPGALLAFAHAEHATQLVLGATRRTWPAAFQPLTAITPRVLRQGAGIGVHIVTRTPPASRRWPPWLRP